MTYQLSRWSVLALFPVLALNCSTEPDSTFADETDTEGFAQFRATLAGSKFEIDDSANLKVDGPEPAVDWASPEVKAVVKTTVDAGSKQNDSSYAGSSKEDIECPPVGVGGIPPQKSDLTEMRVYQ
jgi:hypothetical protein